MTGDKPSSKRSPVIAITGGTGFVGSHFLDLARKNMLSIRALTRKPSIDEEYVQWVSGTLADTAALEQLCDGADVVLHIAGAVNVADRAAFKIANVDGTANVLRAAHAQDVRRFVHVSSLAAREPALSNYGWSKAESERLVRDGPVPSNITIRPPAIYGPRDIDMFEMFRMAKNGIMLLPPPGRMSVIHVIDLAQLLLALALDQSDGSMLYEADDGRPNGWSHAEFARAIGQAMHRNIRAVHVPKWVLELAAKGDRLVRGSKAKLTPDRARYMAHPDWTIDPAKRPPPDLWQPQIATDQGLSDTATWYRSENWL